MDRIEIKKRNIYKLYYYLYISLISFYYAFRESVIYDIISLDLLIYISIVFLIGKVFNTKYTIKESIIIIILVFLGIFSALTSKEATFILVIGSVIGMKNIAYRNVLKIVFAIKLGSSILLITTSLLNVIENRLVVHFRNGEAVYRYALGYKHPNQFALTTFTLICIYFLLNGNKRKKYDIPICILIILCVYFITYSRTFFLLTMLMLCLILIDRYFGLFITLKKVAFFIFPVGLVISYYFPMNLNITLIKVIDSLMQYRFSISKIYLGRYDIKLFGQSLTITSPFDSGYMNLLLRHGLIITLLFLIMNILLIQKLSDKSNSVEIIILISYALYGITENVLYSLMHNFTLVLWYYLVFGNTANFHKKKLK